MNTHTVQKELTAHLLILFAAPAGKSPLGNISVMRLIQALMPMCTDAQKLELQEAYKATKETKKVGPSSLSNEYFMQ